MNDSAKIREETRVFVTNDKVSGESQRTIVGAGTLGVKSLAK